MGGARRSAEKDSWARGRFYSRRVLEGLDVSMAIEELDVKVFAEMLSRFILQVCKKKGEGGSVLSVSIGLFNVIKIVM